MPTDATGPAPEVSAEGRRLIEAYGLDCVCQETDVIPLSDRALSAYVAGLEAEVMRLREASKIPDGLVALSDAAVPDWEHRADGRDVHYIVGPSTNDAIPSPDVVLSGAYSDRSFADDNANVTLAFEAVKRLRTEIAAQRGRTTEGGEHG